MTAGVATAGVEAARAGPRTVAEADEQLAVISGRRARTVAAVAQVESDAERVTVAIGRAGADGRDAAGLTQRLRTLEEALSGHRRAIATLDGDADALQSERARLLARETAAAEGRAVADLVAALEAFEAEVGSFVDGTFRPAASAIDALGTAVRDAEAARSRATGRPTPAPGRVVEVWQRRPELLDLINALRAYARSARSAAVSTPSTPSPAP